MVGLKRGCSTPGTLIPRGSQPGGAQALLCSQHLLDKLSDRKKQPWRMSCPVSCRPPHLQVLPHPHTWPPSNLQLHLLRSECLEMFLMIVKANPPSPHVLGQITVSCVHYSGFLSPLVHHPSSILNYCSY